MNNNDAGSCRRGTLTRLDDSGEYQTLQVQERSDEEPVEGIVAVQPWGLATRPPTASQVLRWLIGGVADHVAGMVMGRRRSGLSAGDTVLYSAHDASVRLSSSGTTVSGGRLDAPTVHTPGIVAGGQTGLTVTVDPAKVLGLEFVGGVLVRVIPRV